MVALDEDNLVVTMKTEAANEMRSRRDLLQPHDFVKAHGETGRLEYVADSHLHPGHETFTVDRVMSNRKRLPDRA